MREKGTEGRVKEWEESGLAEAREWADPIG